MVLSPLQIFFIFSLHCVLFSLERARKLCKTRLLHGPKFREAGETYIQVSNISLDSAGSVLEAVKYLELAVDCFVAAEEKVIAAKTSENVVRLTLTEDFSDCDLIEKVKISLLSPFTAPHCMF